MDQDTVSIPEKDNATIIDGVYVLKRKLGQGGMAAVYLADCDQVRFDYTSLYAYTQVQGASHLERRQKAEDLAARLRGQELDPGTVWTLLTAQGIPVPGPQVALKVAIGEADVARFETEWKSLLCLNHPNVIQVYGGGMHLGRPYYAMELLERIVSPKRVQAEFTIAQKLQVVIQAAHGLGYLHANGIVHRDVKPDNAVVCETLPGEFVTKITDLGIAKQLEMEGTTLTQTAMGTPHYMSPEQFASTKHVDHRADIYSLGATLYELVAGVRPYHDKTSVFELFHAISMHTPPVPVAQHNPALPDAVVGIVECAMAWDAACRYQKMEELVKDIEKYLAEERVEVTGAIRFNADSRAKSSAHIGKDKYAFERYRRKAALRAGMPHPRPAGMAVAAAAAGAAKPAAAAPVAGPKKAPPTLLISLGIAAGVMALVVGLVLAWHASRPPPRAVEGDAEFPVFPAAKAPAGQAGTGGTVAARRAPPTLPTNTGAGAATAKSAPPPTPAATWPEGKVPTTAAELHAALKAKNPNYDGKGEFEMEGGKIVSVRLSSPCVSDYSPLRGLPLRALYAYDLPDPSVLAGMKLQVFEGNASAVTDWSVLKGMPIEVLLLNGTGVITDFGFLQGMKLKRFWVGPATNFNLALLRGMPLEMVSLRFWPGDDLTPLQGLPMRSLGLLNCPNLRNFAPLKGLALTYLKLEMLPHLKDLSFLSNMQLRNFHISGVPALDPDLSVLRGMPLVDVVINNNGVPVTDLSPLADSPLKTLVFDPMKVTQGIDAIRKIKTLERIRGEDGSTYLPAAEFWKKYDAGEFGKPGQPK